MNYNDFIKEQLVELIEEKNKIINELITKSETGQLKQIDIQIKELTGAEINKWYTELYGFHPLDATTEGLLSFQSYLLRKG